MEKYSSTMNCTGMKLVNLGSLLAHLESGSNLDVPNKNITPEIYKRFRNWWLNLDIHIFNTLDYIDSTSYNIEYCICQEVKYIIKLISWIYSIGKLTKNPNIKDLHHIPEIDDFYQNILLKIGDDINPSLSNIGWYVDLNKFEMKDSYYQLPNKGQMNISNDDIINLYHWWSDITYKNHYRKIATPWLLPEYKPTFLYPGDKLYFEDFQLVIIFHLIDICYYSGIEEQNGIIENGISKLLFILNSQRDINTVVEDEISDEKDETFFYNKTYKSDTVLVE